MANLQTLSPDGLAQIPPSLLTTLPALQPPAGVQPNFVNPENRGYIQNSVASVLFGLMICLFANRVYAKVFLVRKASWDDVSCTIGFVGILCFLLVLAVLTASQLGSTAVYIANVWGTSLGPVGKHQWDVRLVDLLSKNFVVTSAIIVMLTPFSLLFTKLTFFLLYFQIFRPLRWLRISVYAGATLTCAFYGAATIAQIVFVTPKPRGTWLDFPLSDSKPKSDILSVPLSAVGLVIDIVLLIMPMVAVGGLQQPSKRKVGVIFIFMFGIFACIGSLLSLYYRVKTTGNTDITWTVMPVETVGVVELFIGVSCACMPALSKTIHHHHTALENFHSVLFSRFASLRSSKSGGTIGQSGVSHSDDRKHYKEENTARGPYFETLSPKGPTPQPTYELGQPRSVHTIIGKGCSRGVPDDQIHLTHEIEQQQTRTP